MKLRFAAFNDAETIAALHAASWQRTYKDALSQSYLEHKALAERQALWRQRFESPQAGQCVLVADDEGQNAEPQVWHTPDGSLVQTYRFAWASAATLAAKSTLLLQADTPTLQ
jgi:hypothetical protein